MWFVIVLILVLVLFFIIRKNKKPSTQQNNVSRQGGGASSGGNYYFRFEMPLSEHDAQYTTATFDSKQVYYNWGYNVGNKAIGSYIRRANGKPGFVFLDTEGREIGFIDDDYPDLVFISRLAIYNNFLRLYGPEGKQEGEYIMKAKYPIPATDLVGKIYDSGGTGFIYDAKTDELIGRYVGNKIGAACAFCALTSEVHSDTEYAKFLVNWDKTDFTRV